MGAIARPLFTDYVVPFELTGILLLGAIVGAIVLAQEGGVMGTDKLAESLVLSALIFVIGTMGVIVRRNVIIMFLCIELQLNAVNLTFVALSRYVGIEGQLFVFFVMTVAAAEAAVGLAIIISIFRHYETANVDNFILLKW